MPSLHTSPTPLYRLGRALIRTAVRIFYRRIVVHTIEHVPPRGPVIFAATHPNSVTDALVLGSVIPRPIRYLAHSGLFRRPLLGGLLRRCGVIPVYRPEDFGGRVDNSSMFLHSTAALQLGSAIGIFPEGTSHQEERVKKLRTGTARIALEAEASKDFSLGVQIVPVGLNFEAAGRFRSEVLVLLGPALVLHEYRQAYREDPVRAVQELTAELQSRLKRLALELPTPDFLPLVRTTVRLLRGRRWLCESGSAEVERDGSSDLLERHHAARDVGAALAWAARERPVEYARYAWGVEQHARRLRRLHLPEAALRRETPPLSLGRAAALGLPLALAGAATHVVPYRLTAWITGRLRPHPTKEALVKFSVGAIAFSLWYAAFATAAWLLFGSLTASLALLLLLLAGAICAMRYLPAWPSLRVAIRWGLHGRRRRRLLERLRSERDALAVEAAELWEAYHGRQPVW